MTNLAAILCVIATRGSIRSAGTANDRPSSYLMCHCEERSDEAISNENCR